LQRDGFERTSAFGGGESLLDQVLTVPNGVVACEAVEVVGDDRAQCPTWLKFLDEVLERDIERISLLQEWFGYCLTPDTSQHKFMILEGEGANGKSIVCEVLTALLGKENVSNVPLEMFGERFQLTPTIGKLANIASEVGEIKSVAEGHLKQFTSGDKMYFDRKGIPGIDA
jgi:putative DNA primase/helicase